MNAARLLVPTLALLTVSAAAPSTRAARSIIVGPVDGVGVSQRVLDDAVTSLRIVLIEAQVPAVRMGDGTGPAAFPRPASCGATCLVEMGRAQGVDLVVALALTPAPEGIGVSVEARLVFPAEGPQVFADVAIARSPPAVSGTTAAVAGPVIEQARAALPASVRPAAKPAPPVVPHGPPVVTTAPVVIAPAPVVVAPVPAPTPPPADAWQGYDDQPTVLRPDGYGPPLPRYRDSKSAIGAFALEFFVPSAGVFYAGDTAGGVIVLGSLVGGIMLVLGELVSDNPDLHMVLAGGLVAGAGRIFGLVRAPMAAFDYNSQVDAQWREPNALLPRRGQYGLTGGAPALVLPLVSTSF